MGDPATGQGPGWDQQRWAPGAGVHFSSMAMAAGGGWVGGMELVPAKEGAGLWARGSSTEDSNTQHQLVPDKEKHY